MKCRLKKTALGRWVLAYPDDDNIGWSGSRWVPMHSNGTAITVQVSNFETKDEAFEYAKACGFMTITVELG